MSLDQQSHERRTNGTERGAVRESSDLHRHRSHDERASFILWAVGMGHVRSWVALIIGAIVWAVNATTREDWLGWSLYNLSEIM